MSLQKDSAAFFCSCACPPPHPSVHALEFTVWSGKYKNKAKLKSWLLLSYCIRANFYVDVNVLSHQDLARLEGGAQYFAQSVHCKKG